MKTLAELQAMRDEMKAQVGARREGKYRMRVVVGMATCGIAAGARPVLNKLVEETAKNNYDCVVTQTGCIGMCVYEPIVEVYDNQGGHTTYVHVNAEKAEKILEEHIGKCKVVEEYTVDAAKNR